MQFQVPQFIETESKIVGPLTLRQFIFIAIGAGMGVFALYFFNLFFAVIFIGIVGSATMALAFVKINGRPLMSILKSAFGYYWTPRLYIWQKEAPKPADSSFKVPEKKSFDPVVLRQKLAFGSSVKNLWEKITASRAPLPKRETMPAQRGQKDKIEVIGLSTGEREAAKRIDYK